MTDFRREYLSAVQYSCSAVLDAQQMTFIEAIAGDVAKKDSAKEWDRMLISLVMNLAAIRIQPQAILVRPIELSQKHGRMHLRSNK